MKKIEKHLPSYLIKIGILIAIFCIGIFAFISWLLEYKDTIDGRILITTPSVNKGEPLAYIENAAQLESCLLLRDHLNSSSFNTTLSPSSTLLELSDSDLGNIQPTYIVLQKYYKDYASFLKNDQHQPIIEQKEQQILLHKEHISLSKEKIKLHGENLKNAKQQFEVDQQLYAEKIISKRTLDQAQQQYDELKFGGRLIDFQTVISNAKIQIAQQEEAIIQSRTDFIKEKERLENQIFDALQLLKKEVKDWEKQYLIIADIDGQINYSEALTDFNYIQKGDKIMTLLPMEAESYIGFLKVPLEGYAKVTLEQPVQVRLDNYPFQEFGIIHGKVMDLSTIPDNNSYLVKVGFPDGLTSSYDLDIAIHQKMEGQASIITNRISLWQRLENQINSARKNN